MPPRSSCTDVFIRGPQPVARCRTCSTPSDLLILGAPHTPITRALEIPDRQAGRSTSWNSLVKGRPPHESLDSPAPAAFIGALPRRRTSRTPAMRSSDSTTSRSTARSSGRATPHPRFRMVVGDAKDAGLPGPCSRTATTSSRAPRSSAGSRCSTELAYDLLAENERITAAAFDAAISAHREARLQKITVVSSSMVFESSNRLPDPGGAQHRCPPPRSTYGFRSWPPEYFAKGALRAVQACLYTIVRPFNCVGIGERRAMAHKEVYSGNVRPGPEPRRPRPRPEGSQGAGSLAPARQRERRSGTTPTEETWRGGSAWPSRRRRRSTTTSTSDAPCSTTVLELAELIWRKIRGDDDPCGSSPTPPTRTTSRDGSRRSRRRARVLGFEANTALPVVLDEIIPWVRKQIRDRRNLNPMDGWTGDQEAKSDAPLAEVDFVMPVYNEGADRPRLEESMGMCRWPSGCSSSTTSTRITPCRPSAR